MARLLAEASIVLTLSDYESQPLAVLEALALGRPTLVQYCGGNMEFVDDGLVRSVPEGAGPDVVAEAVLDLLDSDWSPPPVDLPDWDEAAARVAALYAEVAARPVGRSYGPLVSTFIPSLHGGGAERVVVNLVEELARRGLRQRLVMLEPHIQGNLGMQYAVPEGIEVDVLRSTLRTCVPELARYLRRNPPDVLVSHLTRSNIAARAAHALAGRPCRMVLVEHNTPSQEFGGGTLEHRLIRRLVRRVHPGADAVVSVSRTAAADLEEFGGLRRGSALTLFNPLIPADLAVSAAAAPDHPWFDGRPVIVGLGRLQPEKNWPLLLRAFALVREHRPEARLLILGSGPEEAAIGAEATRLGVA